MFSHLASPHAVPIVRTVRTCDARFHLAIPSLRSLQVLLRRRSKAICFDFFCKKSRIWRFRLLFRQNAVLTNIRLRLLFLKSYRFFGFAPLVLKLKIIDFNTFYIELKNKAILIKLNKSAFGTFFVFFFLLRLTPCGKTPPYLSENDNVVFFYLWRVLPLFVKAGFHEFFKRVIA